MYRTPLSRYKRLYFGGNVLRSLFSNVTQQTLSPLQTEDIIM
jgi:hypothetical protein